MATTLFSTSLNLAPVTTGQESLLVFLDMFVNWLSTNLQGAVVYSSDMGGQISPYCKIIGQSSETCYLDTHPSEAYILTFSVQISFSHTHSNVVEKCLIYGSKMERSQLIQEVYEHEEYVNLWVELAVCTFVHHIVDSVRPLISPIG